MKEKKYTGVERRKDTGRPRDPKDRKDFSSGQAKKGAGRNQRFVIVIGDEGAILIYMQQSKVVRRLFAPSPQTTHTEAMVGLMRANPKVPIDILVDVLDQQYVRQNFPPVSSLSVKGLVERRLVRDFPADDLKGFLPLGRDVAGRKEWKFLLVALAKTPLMAEWLDLLVELPNRIKGIYLSPVEATGYFAALRKDVLAAKPLPWQLLVSHNKISGFRQVVVNEGKLVFTRVTQAIDDVVAAVIAGNIEQEIINTLEYLRRLDFTDNKNLEAIMIVSQDVRDTLDVQRFGFGAVKVMTPIEVAEGLGLEQAALSADRFGDVVMAAAFAQNRKRSLRLSTAYIDRLAKLYLARRGLTVAALIGALAFVGLSVASILAASADSDRATEARTKTAQAQPEMARLQQSVASLNQDVTFKSAVVATMDTYIKDDISPLTFVAEISPFITTDTRMISMRWDRVNLGPGVTRAAAKDSKTFQIKTEFEFYAPFADVEALAKGVEQYLAMLKEKLPQYEITAEPYPWLKEIAQQTVSFDQQISNPIQAGFNKVVFNFSGPNPAAKPAVAAGGTP